MSLSSRVKNKIVDTINVTFASLGHANGMRMPKSENNSEPLAWEYLIAKHVLSLAEKRKDKAETALVKAGLINDKIKDPMPVGTKDITFSGDSVAIMREVRNGGTRVNIELLCDYLFKHGVKQSLIDDAVALATTTSKPPHFFTPVWNTSEDK